MHSVASPPTSLHIDPAVTIRIVYAEAFDPHARGTPTITWTNHVEPDAQRRWDADLTPVDSPVLGPFASQSQAIVAELDWLEAHWRPRRL